MARSLVQRVATHKPLDTSLGQDATTKLLKIADDPLNA